MTPERLPTRLLGKMRAMALVAAQPGLLGLAVRGGDVRAYLALRQPWMRRMRIGTVVDVGANAGQFALSAKRAFPDATLHCFEPLPDCFAALSQHLAKLPAVFLHNIALADRAGTSIMTRSSFSPSSSLLAMDSTHVREFPWTAGGRQVQVSVSTLDAALASAPCPTPFLLKVDVQGSEDKVIAGGPATLARTAVAIVETSFEPLYRGQLLFHEIHDLMHQAGFIYQGCLRQLPSPRDGRVLQADSVFVRR